MISELQRFWTKVYVGNDFYFTCHGWRNLFELQEPVYQELSVEFFATVSFEERTVDFDYGRELVFRLGGVYRECSLLEFGWRMWLYTELETQSQLFVPFLLGCVRDFTHINLDVQFWRTILSVVKRKFGIPCIVLFIALSPFLSIISTMVIKFSFRICSIYGVSLLLGFYCDFLYMLARFMGKKAAGSRQGSPITGGHLVTRLARSYGILSHEFVRNLTRFPNNELSSQVLEVMWVVVNVGGSYVIPPKDGEQEEVQPKQQPPTRPHRQNVRARGEVERGRAAQQHEGGMRTDPFQSRFGSYLDNLCGGMHHNTQMFEAMFSHMGVV